MKILINFKTLTRLTDYFPVKKNGVGLFIKIMFYYNFPLIFNP